MSAGGTGSRWVQRLLDVCLLLGSRLKAASCMWALSLYLASWAQAEDDTSLRQLEKIKLVQVPEHCHCSACAGGFVQSTCHWP
jgi:hypothetical protein